MKTHFSEEVVRDCLSPFVGGDESLHPPQWFLFYFPPIIPGYDLLNTILYLCALCLEGSPSGLHLCSALLPPSSFTWQLCLSLLIASQAWSLSCPPHSPGMADLFSFLIFPDPSHGFLKSCLSVLSSYWLVAFLFNNQKQLWDAPKNMHADTCVISYVTQINNIRSNRLNPLHLKIYNGEKSFHRK